MKSVNCFNALPILLPLLSTITKPGKNFLSQAATNANVAPRWHIRLHHSPLLETLIKAPFRRMKCRGLSITIYPKKSFIEDD